jgi:tetratricopeptide (TPR) repeat protein
VRAQTIVAILLALGSPALANPPPSADARQAAEEGRRAYNLSRWQEAITEFEKAYQISGDPAFLFNLGQAHRQLGHGQEALRLYHAYLREQPNGPNREVAQKQIADLKAQNWHDPFDDRPAATARPAASAPPPVAGSSAPLAPPIKLDVAAPPPEAPAPVITASATVSAPPLAPTPLPRWLPLAGVVTTIALATVAIVYGLSGSNHYNDLASSCGQTAAGCTTAQIDGVKSSDRTATLFWILAGVAAAGTGATVFVNTRSAGVSALWRF